MATTYYVDFSGGLNSNDGLSPASAWKDLFKVRNSNPQPGDTYLFKRGETWAGSQMYITASGTAAQPITYGAYGHANDDLPIISGITNIPLADDPANWTDLGTNIWTFSLAATPGRLFLDGNEFLRADSLHDVGIMDSQGAIGYWYYDTTTMLLHLFSNQNPANLYSDIVGSILFVSVSVFDANHMIFENLDLRGGSGASLGFNGCSNNEVRQCSLGHSANSGVLIIDATISSSSQASSHLSIHDNTFDSDFTFYYGLGSERGCGDGIKLFYGANNCTVSDNTFINWAHNAIELLGNKSGASGVNDNQFFGNIISAPDIPYAHPLGADGYDGLCQNNEFYKNDISNCRTASQINGNNNWVHHNIIRSMRNSPSKNTPTAHAFVLGIYGTGLVCKNNRYDHNLIIDTDESGFLVRGYGFPEQVQGNSIRNNILYETGQTPYNNEYSIGTGLVIYDTNLDGLGGNTYQNNLFYSSDINANAVFDQDNSMYYSASQFNDQNGMEGNIIEDNISGDPLFTDFMNNNYLPLDNSPAVNAGIDTGLSLDYVDNPRFVGLAPDIGPLETDVAGPLPIDWGNNWIEVIEDKQSIIYWETIMEYNSDYFIVERMHSNDQSWSTLGRVNSIGFSDQKTLYHFEDEQTLQGLSYYRVKQVDRNGQFDYSSIMSVKIENTTPYTLARIDHGTLQILSNLDKDWSNMNIRVIDYSGQTILHINGSNQVSINQLPSGMYFLILENDQDFEVFRFAK